MMNRRTKLPSRWALLVLGTCCVLSMIITFRAGAQNARAAAGTAAAAADAKPADTKPADTKPSDTKAGDAKPGAAKDTRPPAAPSKQEESATIPDDPTLVPDDKESADNNVSFPVDI